MTTREESETMSEQAAHGIPCPDCLGTQEGPPSYEEDNGVWDVSCPSCMDGRADELMCSWCADVVEVPPDGAGIHLCAEGEPDTYLCPECRRHGDAHLIGCAESPACTGCGGRGSDHNASGLYDVCPKCGGTGRREVA